MNTFTASNGITVFVREGGTVQFQHGTREESCGILQVIPHSEWWQALREFFRAEEDERLGRWRWPADPNITIRTAPPHAQRAGSHGGTVMIQQDSDGYVGYYDRERLPEINDKTGQIVRAGHAYFDAHPEPKPWDDDPRLGDIWEFTLPDGGKPVLAVMRAINGGEWRWAITDTKADLSTFRDARRIWPEES